MGIVFVRKKNNKVRLSIDARVVNMMFVAAPSVLLLSSEGFAMIELAEGREALDTLGLCSGIGDIADAFHRFEIDRELSRSRERPMELTAREAGVIG